MRVEARGEKRRSREIRDKVNSSTQAGQNPNKTALTNAGYSTPSKIKVKSFDGFAGSSSTTFSH
jgi:hypothetical protein